jgi:hypothetical protein
MSHPAVAPVLSQLAADGGNHASLNPVLTGGGALAIFIILLFAITRFNKDR